MHSGRSNHRLGENCDPPRMGQPQVSLGQRPRNEIELYASPNGATQIHDRRTYEIMNTNCSALSGNAVKDFESRKSGVSKETEV